MYATVRNYAGNRDIADALIKNEAEVKRLISEIDGFRAYYLIRTANGAVSVTVYDSESGARESNLVAADWIGEHLSELAVALPEVMAGEVVISS
jgi:hypothetical protein